MAGRQKKQEARNIAKVDKSRRAQEYFQFRLACVDTLPEANQLALQMPPEGESGREYYSNLAIFLDSEFAKLAPRVSSFEKQLYLDLIGRLDLAGELKAGAKAAIEAAISSVPPARTMADRVAGK